MAYSKARLKEEKDGKYSCIYVGSPIGNIRSNIKDQDIQDYLSMSNGKNKKILVVADSLSKVLRVIGEDHYNDFFLMIDEIDTLQSDNTYRPVLEGVIDYYAKFNQANRAAVSATLRDFTHPELLKDTIITTSYNTCPSRRIELRYTNNEDYCTIDTIKRILQSQPESKIVVAYNSMDGILLCIKLLTHELGEDVNGVIGILCGEMSKDKAGDFFVEIEEDRNLPKQIVFMTCAYFVGIDINEPCHIISVSTFNQPFTLLSKERMAQIVGRCRSGALSETIIYETKTLESSDTLVLYKDRLLRKATLFAKAINQFKEVLSEAPELLEATDYMESIIKYVSIEKVAKDYPVPLLRQDISKQLVPSYFNIDALLERWELHYSLYTDKTILPNKLREQGHIITETPLDHSYTDEQKAFLGIVKQTKDEKMQQDLQQAKLNLLDWDKITIPKSRADALEEYKMVAPKQVRKFYERFEKLSPYYAADYLADLLIEHHSDEVRRYKKFVNSLVFWTLDDKHPLKLLVLGKFEYNSIIGKTGRSAGINVTPAMKKKIMIEICNTYFTGFPIEESTASGLLQYFFKSAPTKKTFRIIGLNPMEFKEPLHKITNADPKHLLDLFVLKEA